MQEMTMVERVARAISKSRVGGDYFWKEYKREARAAIEAMREPTEGMVIAGDDNFPSYVRGYVLREDMSSSYTAMIDAALSE